MSTDPRPEPGHDREPGGAGGASSDDRFRRSQTDAWNAFGLIVSGVLVWGGVGFLVAAWLDTAWPRLVGLLVGMAGGLYLVWLRYGDADGSPGPPGSSSKRKGNW